MNQLKQWWRPQEKLKRNPEMERRLGVPPGHVVVARDEWERVWKRINITPASVAARMLLGWVIGFLIISLFVFEVDNPDPAWGRFWRVRPLIITPLAGAFGILAFYLREFIQTGKGLINFLVLFASGIAFVIAIWLGIVLGLDGTMWN